MDRCGVGVAGHLWPKAFEQLVGGPPEQQCVRGLEPFGAVGVEALVHRQGHHVASRAFVIAVQRNDVGHDQLAHGNASVPSAMAFCDSFRGSWLRGFVQARSVGEAATPPVSTLLGRSLLIANLSELDSRQLLTDIGRGRGPISLPCDIPICGGGHARSRPRNSVRSAFEPPVRIRRTESGR